eukprot:gene21835-26769_t
MRWAPMARILRVAALSSINSVQTNVIIAGATALVGAYDGLDAVAGFGTGVRLEYLLIPLIFGIGAPMVALVATNMGAGQPDRALKIALAGAGLSFVVTEAIGLAAALFPTVWLDLFSTEPGMIAAGSATVMVAGGMESMTNAPYLLQKGRGGYRMGHDKIFDHMMLDGLEDAYEA